MAKDVITRFKLETTSFDSKLRDTAKALQGIAHQAQFAGKDFNNFSQKSIDAARALGTVASGANNTKDKLKDLVGAYNDAAKAYNSLSDAAKKGEFGQAMSASLQKLQQDIKDTKEEFYSLKETASESTGGLFGGNGITGMLQVAGGNLLAKGFTMLASEIGDTVQQSIELARQGEGIRLAFERLNQPGLLDRLKMATHGTVSEIELMKQAIKFDNFKLPLEDLATYLAFAQQKAKDTGESIDYLVTSIVNGLGRQSKQILDNLGISAAELTRRMNEGATMTKAVADIIKEEMEKAGDYVETAADRAAVAAATATDRMEEFGRTAMPIAEAWADTWNTIKIGGMDFLNYVLNPIATSLQDINNLLANGGISWDEKYNIETHPVNPYGGTPHVNQTVQAPGGYMIVTDKSGNVVHQGHYDDDAQKQAMWNTWNTKKTRTGSGGSKQKVMTMNDFVGTMTKAALGAYDLKADDAKNFLSPYKMMLPEIKKNILDIKQADLGGSLAMKGEQKVKEELEYKNKILDQQAKAYQLAGQAATNFGAALAGIEDPAAKAAGTVISAIANIVMGFSMASAQAAAVGAGWGWLAWVGAGLAALTTTISTVHQLTGFAQGGLVQGNTYSGDQIPIMANAGEVVLTKAMQSNLAQQLQGTGLQNLNLKGVLNGEQIMIVLDRHLQRSGRGELAVWK